MAAQAGIVIIGTDPDKCFTQGHVAHGAVDAENILKEIIDVAVNDLSACYPIAAVYLVGQALAFKELHVVVVNGHCMILMLCSHKVEWVI